MDFQKLSGPTFGSVCSGIEAASVALHPQGWRAAWLAEIEAFPSATLAHHYPEVPNLGDMTTLPARVLRGEIDAPEVLVGGTPCQAFSVAGMRAGLADPRGLLSIRFVELADAIDHVRARRGDGECVVWWENVPGVLSDKENAFGCFLAALVGESEPLLPAGGKWTDAGCVYGPRRAAAWRVLDAQYFGLAQRRRRVFVVASARNGFDPAAVLFERDGVRRDSAPRREAREGTAEGAAHGAGVGGGHREVAPTISARTSGGGGLGTDFDLDGGLIPELARCVTTGEAKRQDYETCTIIPATAHTLRAEGFDASEDGTGRGTPLVPVAFSCKDHAADDLSPTLRAMGHGESHANAGGQVAVAFPATLSNSGADVELSPTLGAHNNGTNNPAVAKGMAVRRLTPRECERLQGFPDVVYSLRLDAWHEDEKFDAALSALQSSAAQRPGQSAPVDAHVRIDCERLEVQLLSLDGWKSLAQAAAQSGLSRRPMQDADIARLVALTTQHLASAIRTGGAASLQITSSSSVPLNGSASVRLSGRAISEFASDADRLISEASRCTKFITSEAGQNSRGYEQTLQTLCCCVAAAIGSCIPGATPGASGFALSIEAVTPYTRIPWRGKDAEACPDGPRYKALGNSMAVPVMRWIGRRIAAELAP